MPDIECKRSADCNGIWSLLRETEFSSPENDLLSRELRSRDPEPEAQTDDQLLATTAIELYHSTHGDPKVNPWDAVVDYESTQLLGLCGLEGFQATLCESCPLREFAQPTSEQ